MVGLMRLLMGSAARSVAGALARGSRKRPAAEAKPQPVKLQEMLTGLMEKQAPTRESQSPWQIDNPQPRQSSRPRKRRESLVDRVLGFIPKPHGGGQNPRTIDKIQAAADVAGVADQTGTVDLVNAGVSFGRGLFSKSQKERKAHFKDAAIRAVSAIPVVGDFAKLARARKYGDIAHSVAKGAKTARGVTIRQRAASFFTSAGSHAQQAISASQATASNPKNTGLLPAAGQMAINLFNKGQQPRQQPAAAGSGQSSALTPGQNNASATPARGLTASQKIGMMGAGREAIDAADRDAQQQYDRRRSEEDLIDRQREMVGLFKKMGSGIVGFFAGLAVFPKTVNRWASSLVESRRHLANYNGTLASANAQLDISRLRMDMKTANATAGSGANVVEELKRLQEKMQPFREMKDTVTNGFATLFLGIASAVTDAGTNISQSIGLTKLIRELEVILGMQQQQQPMMPLHHAVQDILNNFGRDQSGARPPLPPLGP
ncbi:MAG: hypothetical protein KDA52_14145 [Planctomycetaceae bacterium]|nr:hypothetical protein [Planctomycetaceae bacterium]